MNSLRFYVQWSGERAAGINPGSEEVTIQFKYGQSLDSDIIEYWQDCLKDFYDGASVELLEKK